MRGFIAGFFGALLVVCLVGAVVAWTINVSALNEPGWIESQLGLVSRHSISRNAGDEKNPFSGDEKAAASGLMHFRDNCAVCHGAPGVAPNEFAKGLEPPPPDLASKKIQSFSDAELHWVASQGVKMTGMPGFGETHSKEEIWHIVTFLRRLPELTPEEVSALKPKEGMAGGHGGDMAGMGKGGKSGHMAEMNGDTKSMGSMDKGSMDKGSMDKGSMDKGSMDMGREDEIKRVAGASGRLTQSPIAGRVAVLEVTDEEILVTVREKDGRAPKDIANPELTLRLENKTRTVKLEGKNGSYRGKADVKMSKIEDATLQVSIDGKTESTTFPLKR